MRFTDLSFSRLPTAFSILLFLTIPDSSLAQSRARKPGPTPIVASGSISEQRAARALDSVRQNPLELREFLVRMPKGTDLHSHLAGAVYAESWIRDGADDKLCVDLDTLSLFKTDAMTRSIPPQPVCGEGNTAVSRAFENQHLYDSLVDAFSMRSFVPSAGASGHDHFFDAFAKFQIVDPRHTGEWLDEVSSRAAAQNEQYLELMDTPPFVHTIQIANDLGWQDDLAKFRQALLDHGLRDDVAVARAHWDRAEKLRNERQHCGQPDAAPGCNVEIRFLYQVLRGFPKQQVFGQALLDHGLRDDVAVARAHWDRAEKLRNERQHCGQAGASSGCNVEIRFLYQVLRGFPKQQVFAQALLGFEVASVDPRVPGINFVMPEDGYISMTDFALHMRMVDFLHGLYPKVRITLHAGEIAPGLVTYEGLCCHVRLAVNEGHAKRIGHGVDVMYENRPNDLLKELAAKHVMVEINLSSNDLILGVTGNSHPFPLYRKFGVPVTLSTDDEGVSRIDLTHEYVRAVQTYNLHYADLKKLVRTGLEHAFLPGPSLWAAPDDFSRSNAACSQDSLGAENPTPDCATFLQSSERARQQWELERRFRTFESSF